MEIIKSKHKSVMDEFFDTDTMSVHLKEWMNIFKKRWLPWWWESEKLEKKVSRNYLNNIIDELYKEIDQYDDCFLEIDKNMSKVIQAWPYRIVIVLPPLSDWIEITVVKPTKKLSIEDYELNNNLLERLKNNSQWILLSGSPWQGKTTFAQALVEMYTKNDNIIKTIESPRDLLVPDEVTQYSFSYAPHSEIRDILLLSRPDYTVYDEIRNADDFQLFKDLRLTWIWLIGVIHAMNAVDSIQRFLWNIEMWIIPQVIDTVIFIKWGKPEKILTLQHTVKTPEWMESADLTRPVIQIYNFITWNLEYEMYSYWEEVVVMPIDEINNSKEKKDKSFWWLIKYWIRYLQNLLEKQYNFPIKIEAEWQNNIKIIVDEKNKWSIIWKQWAKINELEKMIWLSISVRTSKEINNENISSIWNKEIDFEIIKKSKKEIIMINFDISMKNTDITLKSWDETVNITTNKNAQAQIKNEEMVNKIKKEWLKLI